MTVWQRVGVLAAAAAATALTATACGNPAVNSPGTSSASAKPATGAAAIAGVQKDAALYNALPAAIRSSGKLSVAVIDSQPPWEIPASNPADFTGGTADFLQVLGKLLGVKIQKSALPALSSIIPGIQAKRYDFALGPVGDSAANEKQVDFIDWVKEQVVFAVPAGNPKGLQGLSTACGLKIGVIAGGISGPILQTQSGKCTAAGKAAITVQDYSQQPAAILAVQSGRSDAYFSSRALLTYYVQQSKGGLQLAATDSTNGYPANFFQGAVFPKGSTQLRDTISKAFAQLKKDGAYDAILNKWGLEYMTMTKFGVNMVGADSSQ